MVHKGVWQEFMEAHLPAFKEKNPQLEVVTKLTCGQHPHLMGLYRRLLLTRGFLLIGGGVCVQNHNNQVVCVKS
ncbi:unnamed protein product [Spirodela intermedia]|uniref:Large ribosomal subunit protein mL43 n=1 Tax=Spirodela intermedia TaxID=51605 RepID=A0ABN7EAS6_SPIIN|nr:unnamed protein product [Spirodela intermedia]